MQKFSQSSNLRIGVDMGGTKIEIIAIDDNDNEIWRKRRKSPRGNYDNTITAVRELVQECEKWFNKKGSVGVGIPGSVSRRTGLIRGANSTWLNDKALASDLSHALDRPVRVANDANCFALSEAHALETRDDIDNKRIQKAKSVFGIILGTGTGAGFVFNHQVVNGLNGIAGEWGHNPLPNATDAELKAHSCYCGRQGCIETFLCGPALESQYYNHTKESLIATDIAKLAEESDLDALHVMRIYEDRLARALGSVINILDPEVIILGGGISNITRLYRTLPELIPQYVFSDFVDTVILPPFHGDSSGVIGAAWLWPNAK